eukprot:scaffold1220_cov259-Pinguiococcus_pyrenoidosus.AAC.72
MARQPPRLEWRNPLRQKGFHVRVCDQRTPLFVRFRFPPRSANPLHRACRFLLIQVGSQIDPRVAAARA